MKPVRHLYIHIPFCRQRCAYCDFYSETGRLAQAPRVVEALLTELSLLDLPAGSLETLYIGGGTPVLLGAGLLKRLLSQALNCADGSAEVTVEANPRFITEDMAECLKEAGVTRISLGAQSFDPLMRKNLGRAGLPESIAMAVNILRQAGHGNVGLDMIYAVPGQTLRALKSDIATVTALAPEHISYYGLTVNEHSAYRRRWQNEFKSMEDADLGRLFYETVASSLEAAGYRWYETSNFSRPGFECRHNLAYWLGADYAGLGPGAWSTVGFERWRNAEDISGYIEWMEAQVHANAGGPAGARSGQRAATGRGRVCEHLTAGDKLRERLMLGLRLDRGVKKAEVAAIMDTDAQDVLQRNGFLSTEGDKILLTRSGRFVANEVCVRLLKE